MPARLPGRPSAHSCCPTACCALGRAPPPGGDASAPTVFCRRAMVAVGLKATRSTMSSPLEMPPCTPPDLQPPWAGGWEDVGLGERAQQANCSLEGPCSAAGRRQAGSGSSSSRACAVPVLYVLAPPAAAAAQRVAHACWCGCGSGRRPCRTRRCARCPACATPKTRCRSRSPACAGGRAGKGAVFERCSVASCRAGWARGMFPLARQACRRTRCDLSALAPHHHLHHSPVRNQTHISATLAPSPTHPPTQFDLLPPPPPRHLGGGQAHDRLGQLRLQLVKDGGAQPLGAAAHHTRHLTAARLAARPHLVDGCAHKRGRGRGSPRSQQAEPRCIWAPSQLGIPTNARPAAGLHQALAWARAPLPAAPPCQPSQPLRSPLYS